MKERLDIGDIDFLFSQHPTPMWIVAKKDLSILKMNSAALALFGMTASKLKGFTMLTLFPDHVVELKKAFQKKLKSYFNVGVLTHHRETDTNYIQTQAKNIVWLKQPAFIVVGNNISESIESAQDYRDFQQAITNSSIVSRADRKGIITEINENFVRISGYSKEELIGQNHRIINSGYHPKSFWVNMWGTIAAGKSWRGEVKNKAKNGSFYWVDTFIMPLFDKGGKIKEFLSVRNDITSRKQAEETLFRSEQKHKRLYNNLPAMYFTLDNSLAITLVNDNGAMQLGYVPANLIGNSVLNLFPPDEHISIVRHLRTCFANPYQIFEWQTEKLRKDGTRFRVHEVAWTELNLDNEPRVNVISEDITMHEKASQEIFKQKELSNTIINSLPGVFYLIDENGKFLRWNKNFESVTGYSAQEISTMTPLDFFDVPEKQLIFERISKVFAEGSANAQAEFLTKSKTKVPFYFTGLLITYEGKPCLIGMGIDITQQYAAEKAREELMSQFVDREDQLRKTSDRLKLAITASQLGIWTVDFRRRLLSGDQRIEQIWGMAVDNLTLESYWNSVHPDDRARKLADDHKIMNSLESIYTSEFRIIRPIDGEIRYLKSQGLIFRDESGMPVHGVSVIDDQTQQKLYEVGLLKTLDEKDMLIREMHHRVKNNLQLISSMLYLKMLAWNNTDPTEFMTNMREKIKSVALLHERLLQSQSHNSINIQGYLQKLMHDLEVTYFRQDLALILHADIDEFYFTTDYATNLGQLVNELVTNAIKHAFPEQTEGNINISLKRDQNGYRLIVSDNGVGLPETVNFFNPKSYGMQLVQIFVKQLQGSVTVDTKQGTKYTITFTV